MSELLPCPFCGPGNSQVSFWYDDVSKAWRVGCGRCGTSCGFAPRDRTKERAAQSWNTRHTPGAEVMAWAVDRFGMVALDVRERTMRFVEEALELAQAEGLTLREVDAIASRVYSREPGDTAKELAQAGMTLEALAYNRGYTLAPLVAAELERVKAIPKEEFQRRHAAKVAAGIAIKGDRCPHCGCSLETGFGLAGGGYGAYTFCPAEDCGKYFDKTQERGA